MNIDLTKGDGDQPPLSTPPPAGAMPAPAELPIGVNETNPDGTAARPPMPTGQAVMAVDESNLTEQEKTDLAKAGWKPGQPIPVNMAEAIAVAEEAMQAGAAEDRLPVSPNTPPVELNPIDISELPEADRIKYQAEIDKALASTAPAPNLVQQSGSPMPEVAQKVMSARQVPDPARKAPQPSAAPAAEATNPLDAPPAPAQQEPDADDSGAGVPIANCPHCTWDLAVPAVPEPEYEEKMTFLHAVLNGQQFTKEYSLMAGNLLVGFRTLTTREMDTVYQHVYFQRERGTVRNEAEMFEMINRFRMYLQLTSMRASEGRDRQLPSGLSKAANPHATSVWTLPDNPDDGPLAAIESYMFKEVMPTEILIRLVQFNCQQFNRLVSKLEALTDSSDFWTKTEEQP